MVGQKHLERSSAGLKIRTDGVCGAEPVRRQTTKRERERERERDPIVLIFLKQVNFPSFLSLPSSIEFSYSFHLIFRIWLVLLFYYLSFVFVLHYCIFSILSTCVTDRNFL